MKRADLGVKTARERRGPVVASAVAIAEMGTIEEALGG
jgi:hypothetical protein